MKKIKINRFPIMGLYNDMGMDEEISFIDHAGDEGIIIKTTKLYKPHKNIATLHALSNSRNYIGNQYINATDYENEWTVLVHKGDTLRYLGFGCYKRRGYIMIQDNPILTIIQKQHI
jgi:hypothetical protein